MEAVRLRDPKGFRQRRPVGGGGWEWNLQGVRLVPYRLPELIAADPGRLVFITEGEKDVDALVARGFLATTNDIKNEAFMGGRYDFNIPGRPDASIVNQGIITARLEGSIGVREFENAVKTGL